MLTEKIERLLDRTDAIFQCAVSLGAASERRRNALLALEAHSHLGVATSTRPEQRLAIFEIVRRVFFGYATQI